LLSLLTGDVYDDVGNAVSIEPVPLAIILVTIEIDADIKLLSVIVADDAEIYCCVPVTLILLFVFETIVGTTFNPFSKILIIVLKLALTVFNGFPK
jgi:hypothetical protein